MGERANATVVDAGSVADAPEKCEYVWLELFWGSLMRSKRLILMRANDGDAGGSGKCERVWVWVWMLLECAEEEDGQLWRQTGGSEMRREHSTARESVDTRRNDCAVPAFLRAPMPPSTPGAQVGAKSRGRSWSQEPTWVHHHHSPSSAAEGHAVLETPVALLHQSCIEAHRPRRTTRRWCALASGNT